MIVAMVIKPNIEFTVDLEKQVFDDKEWEKFRLLIDFLEVNLSSFVERSIYPLKSFAASSEYFSDSELGNIDIGFLNWVKIMVIGL